MNALSLMVGVGKKMQAMNLGDGSIQALTFSLAAQYLEPLMPKANFKRIEAFFDRAESVLIETKNQSYRFENA